jgi:nitroreductase
MEVLEVIRRRRSVRGLGPVSIPRAHLETIVDAGRLAPSGKNTQPWEFIVITKPETIAALAQVQALLGQASAIVAVVVDEHASPFWLEDASAAAENMLLAIAALGYGSRWIEGTLLPKEAGAKEVLGVPADKRLTILLPIGAPVYPDEPKPKRSLADVLHWERFGNRTWQGGSPQPKR